MLNNKGLIRVLKAYSLLSDLIVENTKFNNGKTISQFDKMSLAANLAGKAISISKTAAPHAVSYPFTSLFNLSHGHAVSLTLNKFLKFNHRRITSA